MRFPVQPHIFEAKTLEKTHVKIVHTHTQFFFCEKHSLLKHFPNLFVDCPVKVTSCSSWLCLLYKSDFSLKGKLNSTLDVIKLPMYE